MKGAKASTSFPMQLHIGIGIFMTLKDFHICFFCDQHDSCAAKVEQGASTRWALQAFTAVQCEAFIGENKLFDID